MLAGKFPRCVNTDLEKTGSRLQKEWRNSVCALESACEQTQLRKGLARSCKGKGASGSSVWRARTRVRTGVAGDKGRVQMASGLGHVKRVQLHYLYKRKSLKLFNLRPRFLCFSHFPFSLSQPSALYLLDRD